MSLFSIIWSTLALIGSFSVMKTILDKIHLSKRDKMMSKALEFGVYDSIWACRKKYKVSKMKRTFNNSSYEEYLLKLTEFDSGEFTTYITEEGLYLLLKSTKKTLPDWTIAYPDSTPAKIVINQ